MQTKVKTIAVKDPSIYSISGRKSLCIRDENGELKSHLLRKLLEEGVVEQVPNQLVLELLNERCELQKRLKHARRGGRWLW